MVRCGGLHLSVWSVWGCGSVVLGGMLFVDSLLVVVVWFFEIVGQGREGVGVLGNSARTLAHSRSLALRLLDLWPSARNFEPLSPQLHL